MFPPPPCVPSLVHALCPPSPPIRQLPKPEPLSQLPCDELQFTLVDCPGHASLIRTIIGGVQIIDIVLLVIDVTKGAL